MKYILCEDSESGFYFWYLINKVFLNDRCIVSGFNGISALTNYVEEMKLDTEDDLTYLICFDNAIDNAELINDISKLQKFERKYPNKIHLTNYICFEQMILSSPNIGSFIPGVLQDSRYKIMSKHLSKDYTDVENLKSLCKAYGLDKKLYSTSERFFRPLLEDNCVISNYKEPVTKVQNTVMTHHYIFKGAWSECWTTDCVSNCPQDFCWKALHKNPNNDFCNICQNHLKNHSCKYSETFNNKKRKYEEESNCNHCLPIKLYDRIRLLFKDSILKQMIGL